MADIATLGLAVDSSQVEKATDSLDKFTGSAGKAQGATDRLRDSKGRFVGAASGAAAANDNAARAANRATVAYGGLNKAAIAAARAVGLIAAALATNALFSYADAWSDMQSRVGAAIKNMEAAPTLMQRIVDIANASYSPLDQTVEVYSRNVAVLRDLGRGATEAADFTEGLNHALVITATRGERAASVQNALSKAMAVGKLQADGLETVLANGGRVAEALAAQLGTNVNGLRAFASAGKITGDVIASALIGNLEKLREEAAEMPATIGDAFTRLRTNLTAFIGQMDQATGASQRVSAAIMLVADNLGVIARAAAAAGTAILLALGPAILGQIAFGFGYMGAAAVHALNAIRVAVMANPIGALTVALTTAVSAAYFFRDEIQKAIGVDVIGIVKTAANYIIGSFVAAYEDVKFVWGNFGNIMGAAVIGGVNIAIKAINSLVTSAKVALNDLISTINMIPGVDIGKFDITSDPISEIDNPYARRLAGTVARRNAAVEAAMSRDWIGDFASNFETAAPGVLELDDAVKKLTSSTGKADKAAEKAAKAYRKIVDGARQFIAEQELERQALGMTEIEASRLRHEMDLLNQAKQAGINLTAAQTAELQGLAAQMTASEQATKAAKATQDAYNEAAQGMGSVFKSLLDRTKDWKQSLLDLIPVVLKLLNTMNIAGGGSGIFGGGWFQSLMGGILGVSFHGGGTVGSGGNVVQFPTGVPYVGKAHSGKTIGGGSDHSEVLALLQKKETVFTKAQTGQIINRLRSSSGGSGETRVKVDVGVTVDESGNLQAFVRSVSQDTASVIVERGLTQYDKGRKARLAADLPDLRRRGAA